MLTKVRRLFEELNASRIDYCHWKSNLSLAASLKGETDLDLLVRRAHASRFREILGRHHFQPAVSTGDESFPSAEHYYALDEETGVIVHAHAYFRVITGESLAKNYRFPIENMLLDNTRDTGTVPVPTKGAELVVFTLRMMMKHTSLVELILLARDSKQLYREAEWLADDDSMDESLEIVHTWLPSLGSGLFADCVRALRSPAPLFRRIALGYRLRSRLRLYTRRSAIRAWLDGLSKFSLMLYRRATRRVTRSQRGTSPQSGGAIIAFVGPEATGKSTLLAEMSRKLGEHFAVEQIHVGKPPSTALTLVPNLFLPALRALLPRYRSGKIETEHASINHTDEPRVYPLIFAVRSVLLAHDRHALLRRAFRHASNGTIVLCDRFPSLTGGAPDSPQLSHLQLPADGYRVRRRLAGIEKQLYREIPRPDLIISLNVPVEVAVVRNRARDKTEPEAYVRQRHARSSHLDFGEAPICRIQTDQPFDQTVLEVSKAIWNAL